MDDAFTWRDGVNVNGTALWCDARRAQDLCFLSNARLELRGPHRQLLCTRRTLLLLSVAGKRVPGEALVTPFGRPFFLGSARLELFPSGSLPGAASLLLMLDRDRRRLVYAGNINPQGGASAICEQMQVREAEAVVCEAPLLPIGRPLPSHEEAAATLLRLLDDARSDGVVPIFLTSVLGTAQEIVSLLCHHGAPVHVHPRIYGYLRIYEEMGIRLAPAGNAPRCFVIRRPARGGEAIVWPTDSRLLPSLRLCEGKSPRVYLCTGAALSDEVVARCRHELAGEGGLSGALPFPDSADLPSLLRYVSQSEARDLYLTAGFDDQVVRTFAQRRVRVHPLGPPRQLTFFSP